MSDQGFRVRRHRRGHEPKRPRRLRRALTAGAPAVATATGELPNFHLDEPEAERSLYISGAAAVLLHAGGIAFLAILAWTAPDIVEKVIPVRIMKEIPVPKVIEAPGSNAAPRAIAPRALPAAAAA
ncbi:MAG: hypothetical protein MJE66_25800, partial [Proteobacteria bacterium]|nr:hypothetical protein [Pseudomonadota bacterium]